MYSKYSPRPAVCWGDEICSTLHQPPHCWSNPIHSRARERLYRRFEYIDCTEVRVIYWWVRRGVAPVPCRRCPSAGRKRPEVAMSRYTSAWHASRRLLHCGGAHIRYATAVTKNSVHGAAVFLSALIFMSVSQQSSAEYLLWEDMHVIGVRMSRLVMPLFRPVPSCLGVAWLLFRAALRGRRLAGGTWPAA